MLRIQPGSARAAIRRYGRRNQSSTIASSVIGTASQARTVVICISMGDPSFAAYLQHGQKGFLWNFHRAHLLHALLARLLFFEEFALAGDIATVAFGEHILAQGFDGSACDHMRADRRLYCDFEHLPRN